jgi:hypothetical protein|tara:strand:- start:73 stop:183 length:111 start_codon:yes stop_codon:yes gene_type:complete
MEGTDHLSTSLKVGSFVSGLGWKKQEKERISAGVIK